MDNSNFANTTDLRQHGGYVEVLCDDGFTSGSGSPMTEIVYCDDGSFNRTIYCYGKYSWLFDPIPILASLDIFFK